MIQLVPMSFLSTIQSQKLISGSCDSGSETPNPEWPVLCDSVCVEQLFLVLDCKMRFFTEIQQIIHRVNPACPQAQLEAETALIEQGILDSLQIVAVIGEIENDLGVRIAIEDVIPENFESIRSICLLIDRTLVDHKAAT